MELRAQAEGWVGQRGCGNRALPCDRLTENEWKEGSYQQLELIASAGDRALSSGKPTRFGETRRVPRDSGVIWYDLLKYLWEL
jgi:hypothetical protein